MKIIIIYPHDLAKIESHGSGQALLSQLKYYNQIGCKLFLAGFDNNIGLAQKNKLESLATLLLVKQPSKFQKKINNFSLFFSGKLNHYIYSKELEIQINYIIKQEKIDIVIAEYLAVAEYLNNLVPGNFKKVLLNDEVVFKKMMREKDQTANLFRKIILTIQLPIIKKYELSCCKQADLLLVYSETEKVFLQKYLPKIKIHTMPPIVPLPEMTNTNFSDNNFNLLFIGNFTHKPNIQAANFLIYIIFPLLLKKIPNIKLYIIGQPKLQLSKLPENIVITGYVNDLQKYYEKAHLILAPILNGGGIRIKILEAMSYGKAIITTTIGAEGIKLENNNLIIANSKNEIVEAILNLCNHKELIQAIGLNARKTIEQYYSNAKIYNLALGKNIN